MEYLWLQIVAAAKELIVLSIIFLAVSFAIRNRDLLPDSMKKWPETRLNLIYYFIDVLAITPVMVLFIEYLNGAIQSFGLNLVPTSLYDPVPMLLVVILAIIISDFVGYWRHRLMHTAPLWPVHAIHHSDTAMTWLTLVRFHPINRLITVVLNTVVLSMLGLPAVAVAVNGFIRHIYGYYVHADLPWDYGKLRYVFVSPVMHRWHHEREVRGSGANFATVFAFYDWLFGTYYVPSKNVPALGITDHGFPDDWWGQMLYPLRVWWRQLLGDAPEQPVEEAR